jgi:hypothetical protein
VKYSNTVPFLYFQIESDNTNGPADGYTGDNTAEAAVDELQTGYFAPWVIYN